MWVWQKFKRFWRDESGTEIMEYLVLTLIVGGSLVVIISSIKGALVTAHNNALNTVTDIAGSGY